MVENSEENAGTQAPEVKPQKSRLPLLTGAIGVLAFVSMIVFIGILAVALWYVWRKGALEWE